MTKLKNKKIKKKKQIVTAIKITIVTPFYNNHGGGIEIVAERLIKEISKKNHYIFTWIASDCDPAPVIENQRMLPMYSINILDKIFKVPLPIWGIKSIKKLYDSIKESNVVWIHDTLYMGNIFAYMFARINKKPIIITQHITSISYKNPILSTLMKFADNVFSKRMLKNADEVTFISDRVAEDYYNRIIFTKPIKVIPNGVDTRLFHLPLSENRRFLRQQFALKSEQPVLLFVGRFVERKGLEVIKQLAQKLPKWRFWLAGNGNIDPNKWLLPNVHVFNDRKDQSLSDLYQAADLFILPSYGEGFPLVIQEAIACGLPVLCSTQTAKGSILTKEFLQTADVLPNDAKRTTSIWLNKIKKLPFNLPIKEPSEEMAEFAFATWNWKAIAEVYADIIKKLSNKK